MALLVGTTAGLFGIEDSTDDLIGGTRVNHVAKTDSGWWAVDGKGRVHHDGEPVTTLPDGAAALCIQPSPDTIWIGANQARLFAFERGEVTEDEFFADAPGRDTWHTPWGAPADVRSMTIDADHTLYVNVHVGGILATTTPGRYRHSTSPQTSIRSPRTHPWAEPSLRQRHAGWRPHAMGTTSTSAPTDYTLPTAGR